MEVAQGLLDEVAARVDEMETARRLPADLAATFAAAGLFRQLVPRSLGGGESHPRELVDTVERMATVNGSAAWCVMIAATTGAMAGWLPAASAREVFGDPLGVWGGAYAPLGRATRDGDAWSLSGAWPWGSGSQNCTWMAGGAVCDDGVFRLCYVPASEVTITDNWDVVGLRGTGSHDWSVDGAIVPVERTVDLLGGSPVEEGPLYRFPLFGLLALGIAAVGLGLGAAALDALGELAGAKTPSLQRRKLAERGTVQAEVARSTAALRAARAYVWEAIDEAWESALEGCPPTIEQRANLRLSATHAAHTSVAVVDSCYTLGGGTAVRNDSPLPRLMRDAHVVTQHLMVSPVTLEPVGRVLLGLPVELLDL
ncbi:MAG: acyl-CoA dehydrogenase family protein [Acidimicrobiales bacterium]